MSDEARIASLEATVEYLKNQVDLLSLEIRGGVDNPMRHLEISQMAGKGIDYLKAFGKKQMQEEKDEKKRLKVVG